MNPLIVIDPGHGGTDRANVGSTGYVEADGVLDIGLRLKDLLKSAGYNLIMTRETDKTVSLNARSEMANNYKADLFISLHTNAGPITANGIETFYTLNNEWGNQQHHLEAKRVADYIQRELVEATGLRDRGIKTRVVDNTSSVIYGKDYYSVIRRSNMPSLIIEMGFHTNPTEEALLKTGEFRQILAKAIFKGIEKAYPLSTNLTPILGEPVASLQQAEKWLQEKAPDWIHMAKLYYEIAKKYNIRSDVALCQSAKETGFYRFGGFVKAWQNNWCGLGATGTASDGSTPLRGADPENVRFEAGVHGAIFKTPEVGVEAHIQHLYAYATKEALPTGSKLYSPRFILVQRGIAPYVEYLGAGENPTGSGWAYPGWDYGKSIVKDYLDKLKGVAVSNDQTNENMVNVENRRIQMEIHGHRKDVEGFFYNDRNYVQIKFLENLGYQLVWDDNRKIVKIDYK